jgi:rabenosyn-5
VRLCSLSFRTDSNNCVDLYGKAKKKILKLDEQDLELFKNEITLEKYYLEISEPQDPGQTRSHTDYFKAVRRERLDHRTTETNKLIIRLDRLLRFYGSDRRQQEQELVAWLDGSTVTRCPSCASSFNITRRQHHCRLCGSIMCNSCSYFLAYEAAQTIVAPVHNVDVNNREQVPGKESDSLRICNHCLDMLESRRRVQMEQMRQPIICQLYNHLQNLKSQTQSSVDLYLKMYNSLTSGETTFHLQDTQALRSGIAKKAELIDTLSKKIASLPVEDDTPKVATLQNSIRRATSHYIKEYLLTLPAPPSMQELEQIKKQRSMRNTEEESRVAVRPHIKKVIVTTGWSPSTVNNDSSEAEDPLIEQMNIVRNYIEQARKAQRFEEVESLQENLKMLKETYRQQQILKDS